MIPLQNKYSTLLILCTSYGKFFNKQNIYFKTTGKKLKSTHLMKLINQILL